MTEQLTQLFRLQNGTAYAAKLTELEPRLIDVWETMSAIGQQRRPDIYATTLVTDGKDIAWWALLTSHLVGGDARDRMRNLVRDIYYEAHRLSPHLKQNRVGMYQLALMLAEVYLDERKEGAAVNLFVHIRGSTFGQLTDPREKRLVLRRLCALCLRTRVWHWSIPLGLKVLFLSASWSR